MGELKKKFKEEIVAKLQNELKIENSLAVYRMEKIIVSMRVKDVLSDKKNIEKMSKVLSEITGQKAKITKARQSIAGFKLRQGEEIGLMVTLRNNRMYDFFEKLTRIVLPRLRDFHGVSRRNFDGKGNYTLGISEYAVFPEIDIGKVEKVQGLGITIVTTAKNNQEGLTLLLALGMPFEKLKV